MNEHESMNAGEKENHARALKVRGADMSASDPGEMKVIALPVLPTAGNEPARDLVCGMTVNRDTTPHKLNHAGETYYFCSAGCVKKFQADPTKYLRASRNRRSVARVIAARS